MEVTAARHETSAMQDTDPRMILLELSIAVPLLQVLLLSIFLRGGAWYT